MKKLKGLASCRSQRGVTSQKGMTLVGKATRFGRQPCTRWAVRSRPLQHRTWFAAAPASRQERTQHRKRSIDFEAVRTCRRAAFTECGGEHQAIHNRVCRSWRHLDFFQLEARSHAEVRRVRRVVHGLRQEHAMPVPLAREGSGFALLFCALGL